MKKLFLIMSVLFAGMMSSNAQTFSARAYMTMNGQQLKLRESADYVHKDPQACASDYNHVGIAAYEDNVRFIQFGTNDLEALPLSVVVPMNTSVIYITIDLAEGTPLYLVDALNSSRTLIVAGEQLQYNVNSSSEDVELNNRFSISKSATPPADIQVLENNLGTFVSNRNVASVTGAIFYRIIDTDYMNHITFEQIDMTNGLAAGTPVLYQKTETDAYVTFTLDDAQSFNDTKVSANGFVGMLPLPTAQQEDVYMEPGDVFVLVTSEAKLKFVDTYCVLTPGHAYISLNAINNVNPTPGRRLLRIGRNGIVSDVQNVAADIKGAHKFIENGEIVIIKNGLKYNVAGQLKK